MEIFSEKRPGVNAPGRKNWEAEGDTQSLADHDSGLGPPSPQSARGLCASSAVAVKRSGRRDESSSTLNQLHLDLGDHPSNGPTHNRDLARRQPRLPSYRLTPADAAVIKRRLLSGEFQSRIAADYDTNLGRISAINRGKKFADVPPAPTNEE